MKHRLYSPVRRYHEDSAFGFLLGCLAIIVVGLVVVGCIWWGRP